MEIKAVCVLKDEHDVYPHPHNLQDPVSGVAGTIAFESQDTNCCLDTYDEYHRTNAVNTYVISIEDTAHKNGTVLIKGIITGLTHGKHGLHVCAFGNLFNGYHSIGPHFNPRKKTHGGQQDEERHVGDLGNVEANEEGVAEFQVEDHLVSLSGTESIIGRAVVIRAEEDDLGKGGNEESLITGNATTGLAWGVIGIAEVVAK